MKCACGCGNEILEGKTSHGVTRRFKIGHNKAHWKGGKTKDILGYIWVRHSKHPNNFHGYVYEHRLIMEKHLGRYLTEDEIVHHINGNKTDNIIENLELMTRAEHVRIHKPRLNISLS